VLILLCAVVLTGCSGGGGGNGNGGGNATLTSVTINGPASNIVFSPNEAVPLTGIGHLSDGSSDPNPQDLGASYTEKWTTSNATVAKVTDTSTTTAVQATVTTVAPGQATITLTFVTGGQTFTAQQVITVDPNLSISISNQFNFVPGQQGIYTVTVTNTDPAGGNPTLGAVTVTNTVPSGLTLASMSGSGWTCSPGGNACTRSDALAAQASYPLITVAVNVLPNATSPEADSVTVSGGDAANQTATDATVIVTCSGSATGNESALHGQYAIALHGYQGSGTGKPVALAASFTANGVNSGGLITAGEEDLNNATAPQHLTITSGSYTVGSDNRGCMAVSYSGGTTANAVFHFALGGVSGGIASKGDIIEFDDFGASSGTRMSGIVRLQDTTSFAIGKLGANYTFGLDGVDFTNGHFAIAGTATVNDTSGAVTGGSYDNNDAGTLQTNVSITGGSLASISSTTGRGLLNIVSGGATNHEAAYIINPSELFVVQIDAFGSSTALISGRAIAAGSSFTSASINGNQIIHSTGSSGGVANVNLGILNFASGALAGNFTDYTNGSSATTKTIASAATYSVATSGRTTVSNYGGNSLPVLYVASSNGENISAFIVGTDSRALLGQAESQPSATYSNSSFSGNSYFNIEDTGDNNQAAVAAAGSLSSGGGIFVRDFDNNLGQLVTNSSISLSFSIIANGTGTGSDPDSLVAVTNGAKMFWIDISSGAPAAVRVIEQ